MEKFMIYKSLNQVGTEEILECINKAFSDYSMPIKFTAETMQLFFKTSDINKALSFCAYSGDDMVGFILNSSNIYNKEPVVFDAGTGVVPEFRGQGIFTSLYAYTEQELCKHGIKKYYLEVLQHNVRAKSLYERNGFSITREFSVMQLDKLLGECNAKNVQVVELEEFNFIEAKKLVQVKPSYEHSLDVIRKNADLYRVAYLKSCGNITTYCIYDVKCGRLIMLGYHDIADLKEVLKYIADKYGTVIAKNIDTSYGSLIDLMLSIGFKQIAFQYEMVKEIPPYCSSG